MLALKHALTLCVNTTRTLAFAIKILAGYSHKTAYEGLWKTQTRYKRHFDWRLCHTKDTMSPKEMVFIKSTLIAHPHILALVASRHLSSVALDTHSVKIQRPNNSEEKLSRQHVVKMSHLHERGKPRTLSVIDDNFRILEIPGRYRRHTVTYHGSDFKKGRYEQRIYKF